MQDVRYVFRHAFRVAAGHNLATTAASSRCPGRPFVLVDAVPPARTRRKGRKAVRRARPDRSDVSPRGLRRPLPPRMAAVNHDPVLPTVRPGPDLHARPLPTER